MFTEIKLKINLITNLKIKKFMKAQNLKILFIEINKNLSGSYYKPTKTLTIKFFGKIMFTKISN